MTHRLLVNPGTPQAWEIILKPGVNRIGRGEANDFQVTHASVSGAHCEVVVSSAGVILRDLGSTNGTFINRAATREAVLQSGQHVQLGSVDMIFETVGAPAAVAIPVAAAAAAPPPPPPPVTARPTGLRFSGAAAPVARAVVATPVAAPVEEAVEAPPMVPPVNVGAMKVGMAFCKFHPKTPARFYCTKCQKYFCDMCVATRSSPSGTVKTCRACGVNVTPVEVSRTRVAGKGFYASVPGAFIYPFRGIGLLILICATIAFSALGFMGAGLFGIFIKIALYGFIFLFMQNIIHTTTSDENEPLGFPDAGDLFGAAFQLAATIVSSFGLAIGLLVAKFYEVDIPMAAIIGATLLGCLYFPMAFLAVAMKDSVMAANPLVVFPAIMRIPVEYFVTAIMLMSVFGIRQLGNLLASVAGGVTLSTRDMKTLFIAMAVQAGIAFVNVYLLTVTMRVLGLLYLRKKEKFGWFSR